MKTKPTVIMGCTTGRMTATAVSYGYAASIRPWRWQGQCIPPLTSIYKRWVHEAAQSMERTRVRKRKSMLLALKAFNKREKMPRELAINSLVRRKNTVYSKWRDQHTFAEIDNACTECMIRFGELPRWVEFVKAGRAARWAVVQTIMKEQSEWKTEVRKWASERRLTRFPRQSAQFLKFYFAWWRYEYEKRNGPVERTYARQQG